MIYYGATGLGAIPFDGAGAAGTDDDVVVILKSSYLPDLEARANAVGAAQTLSEPSRVLAGIQLAGCGEGQQFALMMVFSNILTAPATLSDHQFAISDQATGIRLFLFSGETEVELLKRKEDALARARAWIVGYEEPTWRGFEIAGAGSGRTFMGMFLVGRAAPV